MTGKPPSRGGSGRARPGAGGSFSGRSGRPRPPGGGHGRDGEGAETRRPGAARTSAKGMGHFTGKSSAKGVPKGATKSTGGKPSRPSVARSGPAPSRAASPRPAPKPAAPATGPTRRELREAASEALATGVQTLDVTADEAGMRIDRFLSARFPQLPFTRIQSLVRKGELRVNGSRAKAADRLEAGDAVRVPPLRVEITAQPVRSAGRDRDDAEFLRSITLYEDADVLVLNKPFGLAVQGGSGTTRHVDGLLDALRDAEGQRPRLVHRLDKDTAGCLVVAKTRFAAATLAKTFRSRAARKIYWALVAGIPRVKQGRVSTYLAREDQGEADARMRVAKHGDEGSSHALTYYATVDQAGQKLAWLSLKPVTGRTHQLRAHAAHIGHPIVGDPKYFDIENWELPGGIQERLHLLARRIVIPHPRTGKAIDVSAPLPPHMAQSWNLLGFDATKYDPIVDAPEE